MNYYSEYELEQFNNLFYSNNGNEECEDDSEEDDIKKNEVNNNNNNSLLDEIKEENSYKKIYFQNNDDNEINEYNSYSSSEENNNSEKEYNHIFIENYKSELKKKNYNPKKFPRPKISDLLYKNYDNKNIYLSKPGNYESIPSVISSFINIEDMNSSIKLIRPTQHLIPYNLKGFEKTLNLFGFSIEPFSINNINVDIGNNDKDNKISEYIPSLKLKINYKNVKIAQCSKCKGIYHQLSCFCKKIRNESIYQIYSYKCSICRNKSNISIINEKSNNNYDNFKKGDLYIMPKINEINGICPSIEYLIERNSNKFIRRYTYQIIIIEINNFNNNEKFIEYIYQSLYQIIKENNQNENEFDNYFKYSLIAYNNKNIIFFHLNNKNNLINKNLEVSVMNDFYNPFCPLSTNKLFYDKKDFLFLLEKFQNWLLIYEKNKYINNSMKINISTVINSMSEIFNNNKQDYNLYYHHLIIFSFSYPNLDLNYLKNKSKLRFYISLFLFMNKLDKNIPFINNMIIQNIKIYYSQIDYNDYLDIKQKYEKMYIDLYSILSNKFYKDYLYEINYNISYDKSIFYNKFNKENNSFFITFLPNKKNLNIVYILPQYGYPDLIQNFLFQFKIEFYTIIDNYEHIRILSWYNNVSDKTKEVFMSYDQDTLFKISLYNSIYDLFLKENNKIINNIPDINIVNKYYIEIKDKKSSILELETIIKERIVNTIIKYRREVKIGKDFNTIIIPQSLNNIILYYYCFFKQIITGYNLNLFNLLFNEQISSFIKNIYPIILNLKYLSNIKKEKIYIKPSTIYNLYRNQLLLIDNENYIKILINDKINKETLNHFIINYDLKYQNDIEFTPDYYYLKNIIINKPIKFEFIDNNKVSENLFLNNFIEDPFNINSSQIDKNKSIEYLSYFEYFIKINQKVIDYFCKI